MRRASVALVTAFWLAPVFAGAQIDGERRTLLEAGAENGFASPGPFSPYAFMYFNRPGVVGPGSAWRLALAPVYADTELGLPGAFGERTDIGLGFSGGGYAFGHAQVIRGDEKPGEAFIGHGGGPSISLYPRIGKLGPVPISGVFRLSGIYTDFQRTARSDASYEPPPDVWTGIARGGIRAGGAEPGMDKGRSVEVSLWAETRVRDRPGSFGYQGDRNLHRNANLFWTRAYASLPIGGATRLSGGVNAGGGGSIDRLAAYRLGGMLTQTSEFPLVIPGYFAQEISASRYVHAWSQATLPLLGSKRFHAMFTGAAASVHPIAGTDPGGTLHAGLSMGMSFEPPDGALRAQVSYGYAPTAVRGARRGAHAIAVVLEIDFLRGRSQKDRVKTHQQGLRWLLGR